MVKSQSKAKFKPRFPKLSRLQGLMKEYDITVAQLAKSIGRAISTVSKSNNGYNLYDSMDMKSIQKLLNEKEVERAEKLGRNPVYLSLDDIFYS